MSLKTGSLLVATVTNGKFRQLLPISEVAIITHLQQFLTNLFSHSFIFFSKIVGNPTIDTITFFPSREDGEILCFDCHLAILQLIVLRCNDLHADVLQ